jgi:hypothetical protein
MSRDGIIMSDLTVSVFFTRNTGQPATGLALADIDMYLTEQDRATGADTVIWDGTQNPTEEIDNIGAYIRIYANADLDANNYYGRGTYTGAVGLDTDDVMGAFGIDKLPIGTAVEFTYTVTNSVTTQPEPDVTVTVSTDLAGTNLIWSGTTDAFGVARDVNGDLPRLDPGTYYFFKSKVGFIDDQNPDTEVVS